MYNFIFDISQVFIWGVFVYPPSSLTIFERVPLFGSPTFNVRETKTRQRRRKRQYERQKDFGNQWKALQDEDAKKTRRERQEDMI